MLTIKAPIEPKARTGYLADQEAFCRRIAGSYELMNAALDTEDLLHLAATPPEIYVVEGGQMAGVTTNSTRNETNIHKVEILNNVLNRILMSTTAQLTYQDRVFITDALYKLGVRDEKRFMSAFYRMVRETKNTNELIDVYLQNAGHLHELIENIENNEGVNLTSQMTSLAEQTENRLYQSVFDRLMTGAVYQIVSNFNRSTEENKIENREYMVSEQSYSAQQILLSMLRQSAGMSDGQVFYLSGNVYEEAIENLTVRLSEARNEITSAVLLDLTRNLYHAFYDRFSVQKPQFYHFEDAFYRSSTHTLERLARFEEGSLFVSADSRRYEEQVNRLSTNELNLLYGIIGQEFYTIMDDVRTMIEQERSTEREIRTVRTQEGLPQLPREEFYEEEGQGEPLDLVYEEREAQQVAPPVTGETPEEIEQITRAVDAINIRNEERRRQYEQILRHYRERERATKESGIKRTRDAAKLALENPEDLRKLLEEEAQEREQKEKELIRELSGVFPKESRRIYELLNQYMENAQVLVENQTLVEASPGELMQDMRVAEAAARGETIPEEKERIPSPEEMITPEKAAQIRELLIRGEMTPQRMVQEGLLTRVQMEELIYAENPSVLEPESGEETAKERRERDTIREILRVARETERLAESGPAASGDRRGGADEGTAEPAPEELVYAEGGIIRQETIREGMPETQRERELREQILETARETRKLQEFLLQGQEAEAEEVEAAEGPTPEELIYAEGETIRREIVRGETPVTRRERETMRQILETRKETERLREIYLSRESYNREELREDVVTPAEAVELIHDLRFSPDAYDEDGHPRLRRTRSAQEIAEEAAQAAAEIVREDKRISPEEPTPVDTVYRRQETMTGEELEETIREMQDSLSKQISKRTQELSVQTTTDTTRTVVHENANVQTQVVDQPDINRLIQNGVQSQINAISDQVFRKLERQMRNEKARRGYH